jgi:quercetin 2,3-dioxygenase
MSRRVASYHQGNLTSDGAGVKLRRVFGHPDVPGFDPFLMLDFFDSRNPEDYAAGFPWHPHRGIETVTFLLAGHIEHGDSLGNTGIIGDGDCQWMTAGSGIIHQEMPKPSGHLLGIQLWVNLPASAKMTRPRYQEIAAATIPEKTIEGGRVRIICGSYATVRGPASRPDIGASFLDVTLEPAKLFKIAKEPDHRVFALLVAGSAKFDDVSEENGQTGSVALYASRLPGQAAASGEISPAEPVQIQAGEQGARFLLISGKPIGEPVAWGGPIVMNTQQELALAFQEYRNGKFIKSQSF